MIGENYSSGVKNVGDSEIKRLYDLLNEINTTVARLDTRMESMEKVEKEVTYVRNELGKVKETAQAAKAKAEELERNQNRSGSLAKWAIGLGVSSIISMILIVVTVIGYFMGGN